MPKPKQPFCKNGHTNIPENRYYWDDGTGFVRDSCKICGRKKSLERYHKMYKEKNRRMLNQMRENYDRKIKEMNSEQI